MINTIHRIAALVATLAIATFFGSTLLVELFGDAASVTRLKSLIVWPGLALLIPAIAAAGGTGFALARSRRGRLVDAKRRRMPFIGANGLLVLVPCALVLDRWASAGRFDAAFVAVQAVELIAGATNLWLISANIRDGLRLSGRLPRPAAASR